MTKYTLLLTHRTKVLRMSIFTNKSTYSFHLNDLKFFAKENYPELLKNGELSIKFQWDNGTSTGLLKNFILKEWGVLNGHIFWQRKSF